MRRNAGMVCGCLLSLGLGAVLFAASDTDKSVVPAKQVAEKPIFARDITPLMTRYCVQCHGREKARGGLVLDSYKDEKAAVQDLEVWEKVAQRLRDREMPPAKRPQPTAAERESITSWVSAVSANASDCISRKDPGRVTLRRLNRTEYNNTIHDLLGVNFQPAEDFPADDVGNGFDNIGDVLTVPPLLLEKYLAAAEKIVTAALANQELRKRIFICVPKSAKENEECARKIVSAFARRAYRRPLAAGEVERLAGFVQLAESQGDGFAKGIELALEAILTSPHFLFRIERDPRSTKGSSGFTYEVGSFELATRLSYFLWSTMPDDELLAEAKAGSLRKNLDKQVRRMLKDPRSGALVDNFAGQWLQLRSLKNLAPDRDLFRWDDELRTALQKETELFFKAIMDEDRSILDFIDTDFTFLNQRLAEHYGIAGVKGKEFRRVKLEHSVRGGLLTQGSILTLTSNPTRTSPVKRGKWILENILGTPPPPPPPNVPELSEDKAVTASAPLRKRMEQHRANPNCATCHERMDTLGFSFENFDGIGAWREKDSGFPIDPSGTLPDGRTFKGPQELKAILKSRKDEFSRCLTEKMLTYAVGRGMESYDKCAIDQIIVSLARNDYRFSSLVSAIVKSDPFQKRRSKNYNRDPKASTAKGGEK